MNVAWMPPALKRRLKTSAFARRAITRLRGEHRRFHDRLDMAAVPPLGHALYIGTHHKTGTVWLQRTFGTYARLAGASLVHVQSGQRVGRGRHTVILDYRASQAHADLSGVRGLRMVRDPRDVLVSAMLFHRRAEEPWLHAPWKGGATYQERIARLTEEDALLFEMDNWSGRVIREMLAFNGGGTVRTVRYEDYLYDADMALWHPLLRWMGLTGADLLLAQQALYERSLFGLAGQGTGHVSRRKTGWQPYFTPRVAARFEELFGDAPARLGYDSAAWQVAAE